MLNLIRLMLNVLLYIPSTVEIRFLYGPIQ
jgi:hypothetical protein